MQIDGSPHDWFEDRGPRCTLIVFIDDATSELMSLQFWPQETTEAYMSSLRSYLQTHGRPVSLYSDKHAIFKPATDSAEPRPSQFGRVTATLDIESILAQTPQAKGRVERVNRTLQDRLVKEMRLRGINTLEAGNAFMAEFITLYNNQFSKPARHTDDAHREVRQTASELDLIFSVQVERAISKNLEIRFDNSVYQLSQPKQRRRLSGKKATVCKAYDGTVSILIGNKQVDYKIYVLGQVPKPTEDAKTLNGRVDQAIQQQSAKSSKPAQNHPWRRIPTTSAEIRRQDG